MNVTFHLRVYIRSLGSRKLLFNDSKKDKKKKNTFVYEDRLFPLEKCLKRAQSENKDTWVCVLVLFISYGTSISLCSFVCKM